MSGPDAGRVPFFAEGFDVALVKCKECQALISTQAASCPNCGAKPRRKTSLLTWVIGGCFALIVFNFSTNSINRQSASPSAQLSPEEAKLAEQGRQRRLEVITAKNAVTERMKDPDSVRFGEVVNRSGTVCGYVNAKNSFGGYTGDTAFIFETSSKDLLLHGQTKNFDKVWNDKCPAK